MRRDGEIRAQILIPFARRPRGSELLPLLNLAILLLGGVLWSGDGYVHFGAGLDGDVFAFFILEIIFDSDFAIQLVRHLRRDRNVFQARREDSLQWLHDLRLAASCGHHFPPRRQTA